MEIGPIIDLLYDLKDRKATLNNELKLLNAEIKDTESTLLRAMRDQNLTKASVPRGAVYVTPQMVPHVTNWDEFYAHIRANNAFHLLERRPSRKAYNEDLEAGIYIPGVDPHLFDEIRTRKS